MPVLLWLAPAWLLGIFLNGWLKFEPYMLLLGVVVGLLAAVAGTLLNRYSLRNGQSPNQLNLIVPLCLAVICLAGLRYEVSLPSKGPEQVAYWAGDLGSVPELRLKGVVSGDPVYTEKGGSYRLSLREIWPPGATGFRAVSGDIYVKVEPSQHYEAGELLELAGKLYLPAQQTEDGFPYRDYLNRQGMYAVMSKPQAVVLATHQDFFVFHYLNDIQNGSLDIINRFMEGKQAGLLGGILLGEQTGLDPQVKDNFRRTGSTHIIAISGANITITVGVLMLLFGRFFSKKPTLYLSLIGIFFYVLLVGASPGVIRAGVMGGFAIGGLLLGREYTALYGLFGTALFMTLISPQVLYDIGFELSFMATLGLILIAQPLQNLSQFKNWPAFLKEGLIMGFAAEAMTLPLSIFYFKQISLVSLPTSLLALPALPIIMATGAVLVGGGWVFSAWLPGLVSFLGWLSWLFLAYMIAVIDFFASLPFASVSLNAIHPIWLVVYYGLLAFVLTYARSEKFRLRVSSLPASPIALGVMGFSAVGIWVLALFF